MKYFENCSLTNIRAFFEKSKLLSSHSTLLDIRSSLHGTIASEKLIPGREDYSAFQRRIIRNLKIIQIKELIDLDVNYILPYLGTQYNNTRASMWELTNEGKKTSEYKCKNLLKELYGEKLSEELEECVNKIYSLDMNEKINNDLSYTSNEMQERINSEKNYTNYFKILFDKNIILNNSIEDINAYFSQITLYEEPTEEFYKLIKNAYGDSAVEILKSRPGLNVHTINSLEDLDNRIISNFGDSFVHNLLNYNIRDHQELMGIIKDEKKLECFKTYYELLSEVLGYNAETMQRAISEYNYFDKLLQNIKDKDLTEKQYSNLVSVLCSRDNQFNINTLEELQNYEEISNKIIKQRLEVANGNTKVIKEIISRDILGFSEGNREVRDYGYELSEITNLYDISMEKEENNHVYTADEKRMLDCLDFIQKETNPEILLELALDLISQKEIQNPIIMHNAVKKMTEHQTDLFNSSLLTIEKMDELCKEESEKENPKIIKEILENGLTRYVLKGIDFKFMPHHTTMSLKNLIQYEGHLGVSNICTRLISQESILQGVPNCEYIYTSIKEPGGIQAFACYDANTDHVPRRLHGIGGVKLKLSYDIIEKNTNKGYGNEIAQNRNLKRNADINNKNMGGKIIPDAILKYSANLSKENIEIMKKYNIAIVCIDRQAYIEIAKNKENKEKKENVLIER